jgi:hypothetical protein
LVVVQSNLFGRSPTLLAIPLVIAAVFERLPDARLNPRFVVEGREVVLDALDLAAFPRAAFDPEPVCTLQAYDDEIVAAIDLALARGY